MLDALAVVVERLRTVAEINGTVEGGVGFDERGRHRQGIVKVGERGVGELFARVQHGLRGGFHDGALFGARRFGPREIVVNEFIRVAISGFQPPADLAHPRHVHVRRQGSEVV